MEERGTPRIDLAQADAQYEPFPEFEEWDAELDRPAAWSEAVDTLSKLRQASAEPVLQEALSFVLRAAALNTGAIEGLYDVDRGFTYTIAAQAAAWDTVMDGRNKDIRPLFDAQLAAFELVMDAATGEVPIVEAWLRRLHEEVCAAQETYRVLTDHGWDDRPLVRGAYKTEPNHVVLEDGSVHSYAPVADTGPEMQRLAGILASESFRGAHPVVQAAYAHHALVAVHPFSDGNGRVARALASVFLYRAASVPLLVFADRKGRYFDALSAADAGEQQQFTTFTLNAALTAINLVVASLRAAAAPRATVSLGQMRRLLTVQGALTHKDMDRLANSVYGELGTIAKQQLNELQKDFPPGMTGVVDGGQESPPLVEGFRLPQGRSRFTQIKLNSPVPAEAQVWERFFVLVSTGRDSSEAVVVMRRRQYEELRLSLDDVNPDLSLAGEAQLRSFLERVWSELLDEILPLAEQSLKAKGLIP